MLELQPEILIMLALAFLVGISLGLLGGGGSILTVPILTYVVGMETKVAIASSLFIVGVTSIGGLITHARGGRVMWKMGVIFGLAGMVGAYLGGFIGGYIADAILMLLFAIMMVVTAIAMIRKRKQQQKPETERKKLPLFRIILDGLAVGFATGLVGSGGGFLIVPALNMLGGLPMAVAVGTSLLIIVLKSFAGLAGYLNKITIDWSIVLSFSAVAIIGSFVGAKLSGKIPEDKLRKGFGIFVLLMGAFVIYREAPGLLELLERV